MCFRLSRILATTVLAGCVMAVAPPASIGVGEANAALIATPPNCSASFDAYDYTPAALAVCGIKTFPLTSVSAMLGGGLDYAYAEADGLIAHQFVPPSGFNPVTAPDAQLMEYALPPRPRNIVDLAHWQSAMGHLHLTTPPAFLVQLPATVPPPVGGFAGAIAGSTGSGNWSGYGLCPDGPTSCTYDQYSLVQVTYLEPSFNNYSCDSDVPGPAEVTWAGIGGWTNKDILAQDGTGHDISGLANHGAWYEEVPGGGITPFNNPYLTASPGDAILASVQWEPSSSSYVFTVFDYNTGASTGASIGPTSYTGDSAEAIAERPEVFYDGDYWLTPLSNFGTLSFTTSGANGTSFYNFSPSGTRWGIHMNYNGTDYADPGGIGTNGNFSDVYNSCGSPTNLGP